MLSTAMAVGLGKHYVTEMCSQSRSALAGRSTFRGLARRGDYASPTLQEPRNAVADRPEPGTSLRAEVLRLV